MEAFLWILKTTPLILPHAVVSCLLIFWLTKKPLVKPIFKISVLVTLAYAIFFYTEATTLLTKSNLAFESGQYAFSDVLSNLAASATRVFDIVNFTYFTVNYLLIALLFYYWLWQTKFFKTKAIVVKIVLLAVLTAILVIGFSFKFFLYVTLIYGT